MLLSTLNYALRLLWFDHRRFLPAVIAVGFSALLITVQCAVLIGTLALTSIPIDASAADIFVASKDTPSIEVGHPIPEARIDRLLCEPDVEQVESYLYGFDYWYKPAGGSIMCCVIGSRLDDGALGSIRGLTPELRLRLTEPGTVVVDESERDRLGLVHGIGEVVEVADRRVRVIGLVHGYKTIGGPYVFCSLRTARMLLSIYRKPGNEGKVRYILARCRPGADVAAVAQRLQQACTDVAVFTRSEFSQRTRLYWLSKTKAGIALLFTSGMALLVGLVVTSQTLYAATVSCLREYALLRAVGIPRWKIGSLIVSQSFWVGLGGLILALPSVYGMAWLIEACEGAVVLPGWLVVGGGVATLLMALLSGLLSLRSLRLSDPVALLR